MTTGSSLVGVMVSLSDRKAGWGVNTVLPAGHQPPFYMKKMHRSMKFKIGTGTSQLSDFN